MKRKKTINDIEYQAWMDRASYYDDFFESLSNQAIDYILNTLVNIEGSSHLDIACGTGHLVANAQKRGAISEGVDFAPNMIDVARANYPFQQFRVGNATHLPYNNEMFDAVTCSFGLSHVEDPQLAVNEAFRVLKDGGLFTFTLWFGADNGAELLAICQDGFNKYATVKLELPQTWTQLRYANKTICENIVKQAGFNQVSFQTLPIVLRSTVAQSIVDILLKISIRTQMNLESQPAHVQDLIQQDILINIEKYRKDGQIVLKWPALLTLAQKTK